MAPRAGDVKISVVTPNLHARQTTSIRFRYHLSNNNDQNQEDTMNQLGFRVIEEDILASCIRRQTILCSRLIRDLESRNMSEFDVSEKIHEIELGLKRLCQVS